MDVVVVGGGIAGVGVAAALVEGPDRPSVTLIEAEPQLAHHTTGRSAAQLIENYGAAPIRALTLASRADLDGLLAPRALLTVGTHHQGDHLDRLLAEGEAINPTIREIPVAEAVDWFPLLRPETVDRAVLEPDSADIDVAGLHQALLNRAVAGGATVERSTGLLAGERTPSGWRLDTTAGERRADLVVDAAGAWGDVVAERCGVSPIGLRPLRRTAFMVASPVGDESRHWPLVADAEHRWYCKPDGPQFLCSPADETPSEPCDAKPDELDVALAIDRLNAQTRLAIRSVRSAWAGLRTFSPDGSMVIGPDPDVPSFVWCVGQGGTGIQTAPAAGRLAAALALDRPPSGPLADVDLDLDGLEPKRFEGR